MINRFGQEGGDERPTVFAGPAASLLLDGFGLRAEFAGLRFQHGEQFQLAELVELRHYRAHSMPHVGPPCYSGFCLATKA